MPLDQYELAGKLSGARLTEYVEIDSFPKEKDLSGTRSAELQGERLVVSGVPDLIQNGDSVLVRFDQEAKSWRIDPLSNFVRRQVPENVDRLNLGDYFLFGGYDRDLRQKRSVPSVEFLGDYYNTRDISNFLYVMGDPNLDTSTLIINKTTTGHVEPQTLDSAVKELNPFERKSLNAILSRNQPMLSEIQRILKDNTYLLVGMDRIDQ